MSKGVNKVIIVGNVAKDIEVKYMPDGTAVVNMIIVTSEKWKDKNTGEDVERPEWHRIVMYRKLAEIAEKYVKKGIKLYLEGKLRTTEYEDKNNIKRYATNIVADEMQMLTFPSDSEQKNKNIRWSNEKENQSSDDFDDEIPF